MAATDTRPTDEEVAQAKACIEAALLKEYNWHDHDCWSSDEDNRAMYERGDNPWPHLSHVAEVAAYAVLSASSEAVR